MERCIGQLKRRFHVLHGEVCVSPQKTCKIIHVCAILHNICKDRNIPLPPDDADDDLEDAAGANENVPANPNAAAPDGRNGHRFRDYIANLHFK